ncbi:MAG: hypothetical protein KC931_24560, partial [Candidatus Omnitrophica bacterium]|nr:hypothetical protein [Candidatus Omnitrophota bacterium]
MGPAAGRVFSLNEKGSGSWSLNLQSSEGRTRKQFRADSLEEAIDIVEEGYFDEDDFGFSDPNQPEISTVFRQWKETLTCKQSTIDDDYWRRVKQFVDWTDAHGMVYWGEILSFHLQKYAVECLNKNERATVEKRCRVVRSASKFAKMNYPQHRFEMLEFSLPRQNHRQKRRNRDTLTVQQATEFLFFLRDQPFGWNGMVQAVALEALAS